MRFLLLLLLTGCVSATKLNTAESIDSDKCKVTIFTSKEEAEKGGKIIERVLFSAATELSRAIYSAKYDVCEYGADNIYVKQSQQDGFGASAVLVGFSYVK